MSGFNNNRSEERRESLLTMAMGIMEGKSAIEYLEQNKDYIDAVIPEDVIYLVDEMVDRSRDMELLKKAVSKLLNIFYESLSRQYWHFPSGSFLNYFVLENQAIDLRMKEIKKHLKTLNKKDLSSKEFNSVKEKLLDIIAGITEYEKHYIRKENILFPRIEKELKDYRCMQVMWSIHDDFRKSIKNLSGLLQDNEKKLDEINREMGRLFFAIYPIIFREEKILFPVSSKLFAEKEMKEMHQESLEIGFSFIQVKQTGNLPEAKEGGVPGSEQSDTVLIDLGTGSLKLDQITMILNLLPVDMTFVDENDEVRYFSNPSDRIFPRSKSIIGRKVQNCHPPESMQMVEDILDSFKDGTKDKESFWINMKDKFILIQYFAARDEQGNYRGTLELSQDASWTRSLQGEKRLIDQ